MAPALPKKKLSKSKLSMYLRTQCDRELYLSLFSAKPDEMASAGLPVPLKSRPNVQLVTGAGNEFEHTQFQMLVKMLVGNVRYAPKFSELNLKQALTGITAPTLCLQPGVEPQSFRGPLLTDLGVSVADQKHIPPLAGMRPDVILVDLAKADDWEVLCSGDRKRISSGEKRLALSVIDLKNVAEGNSSYAAEVCLYAIILANWLRFEGLHKSFYVSEKTYLWTTPVPAEFDALFKGNPTATGADCRTHAGPGA